MERVPADDGLVGIFNDIPFFLRDSFLDVDFIALHPAAPLHHVPAVHAVFEDRRDSFKGEFAGMREMRKHVAWYTAGYPNSAGL